MLSAPDRIPVQEILDPLESRYPDSDAASGKEAPEDLRRAMVPLYRIVLRKLKKALKSSFDASERASFRKIADSIFLEREKFIATLSPRPVSVETNAHPPILSKKIAEKSLFDALQASPVPERERQRFLELYATLPPFLKPRYQGPVIHTLKESNPVHKVANFRAYLFELTQRQLFLNEGLEPIEESPRGPLVVPYMAYDKSEKQFKGPPQHKAGGHPRGDIESDIEWIVRDGLPYIYEAKCISLKAFGREHGRHEGARARNQLLKYQAAIRQGKISGATLEVRGTIDADFFDWILRDDTCPDVEVVYNVEAPDGTTQRFVLKPSRTTGLHFRQSDAMKALNSTSAEASSSKKTLVTESAPGKGVGFGLVKDDLDQFFRLEKQSRRLYWDYLEGLRGV